MHPSRQQIKCARGEEIGAYLDGELSVDAQSIFESHLHDCAFCSAELRNQQGWLRTLDMALTGGPSLELPDNFTRLVAVRAESDLGGVRNLRGGGRALRLSAVLGLLGFFLLTFGRSELAPAGIKNFAMAILGLLDILSRTLLDLVFGLMVVLRAAGRWLVQTPSTLGVLSGLIFVITVIALARQLRRFHRS